MNIGGILNQSRRRVAVKKFDTNVHQPIPVLACDHFSVLSGVVGTHLFFTTL